jgi:hypothetical protein
MVTVLEKRGVEVAVLASYMSGANGAGHVVSPLYLHIEATSIYDTHVLHSIAFIYYKSQLQTRSLVPACRVDHYVETAW